jgi:hypothetical protein
MLRAFAYFALRPARGQLMPFPGGGQAAAAEYLKPDGNGAKRTDQEKRPAHGPALVRGEAVGEQQTEAGAKRYPCASDQSELWKSKSSFPHGNTSQCLGARKSFSLRA